MNKLMCALYRELVGLQTGLTFFTSPELNSVTDSEALIKWGPNGLTLIPQKGDIYLCLSLDAVFIKSKKDDEILVVSAGITE